MKEYSSSTFKNDNAYLTGVKKNLVGWKLTTELVKSWVYPMKFCEADPYKDFFGVEMKNCGPAAPAQWNACPMKFLSHLFYRGEAYSSRVGLPNRAVQQIVLGLKMDAFSAYWTY